MADRRNLRQAPRRARAAARVVAAALLVILVAAGASPGAAQAVPAPTAPTASTTSSSVDPTGGSTDDATASTTTTPSSIPSTTTTPSPSTAAPTTSGPSTVAPPLAPTTTVPNIPQAAPEGSLASEESDLASEEDPTNSPFYVGAPWFRPDARYDQNFPDPTVVWDPVGQRYWAYATSTGGPMLPAMWSTDLVTWTARSAYSPNIYNDDPYFNDAFPVPPRWSLGGTSRVGKAQWAPGVTRIGGSWVAYTSWEVAPGRRCISAAASSSPAGPFVDTNPGPIACDDDPAGSIDPEPFVDRDGTRYLLWKATGFPGSAPTRLKAQPLAVDGLSFRPGSSPTVLLETALPWDGDTIENPTMARYGGTYWLLYSGNEWASSDYRMGQAACAGPLGPCTRTSSTPLFGNSSTDLGPGGGSMFVDQTGRLRLAYHRWNAPFSNYPADPQCDGPGICTSQGQRYLRIDGLVASNGKLSVDPVGSLDVAAASSGAVTVTGWALDPSSTEAIQVHAYVDGVMKGAVWADSPRPDVGAAYPGLGADHGFAVSVAADRGPHQVCLYGINVGAGGNQLLGCRTVVVPEGSPFGSLDIVAGAPGGLRVAGWAIDPDTRDPIEVHAYVGASGNVLIAGNPRPDVGAAYPLSGASHGYDALVPAPPGWQTVCAYGINVRNGANTLLGCGQGFVPYGSPTGSLDVASASTGTISVAGWALDPDVRGAIDVHVYVDGSFVGAVRADSLRPDLVAVYPAWGPGHGFSGSFRAGGGAHSVCAYGINVGIGGNDLLGCRTVVVPDGSPFGSLDLVTAAPGGVRVAGWAIDPNTREPIEVHVYAGGSGTPLLAGDLRPDVGLAYPSSGPSHGFSGLVSAPPGWQTVCAYGINVGDGGNQLIGCGQAFVA